MIMSWKNTAKDLVEDRHFKLLSIFLIKIIARKLNSRNNYVLKD